MKVRIGISSCLLGQKVRFDGGHKNCHFCLQDLHPFVEYQSVCPEMAIGLPSPRPAIRLQQSLTNEIRLVQSSDDSIEHTKAMHQFIDGKLPQMSQLSGYIVCAKSPTCGMERVKVYSKGAPNRSGVGLYAQGLMNNFPHLPVEEEGRLEDPHLRENFIQRVYVYRRWLILQEQGCSLGALQDFHARHKYIFMSHNQQKTKELGALMANHDGLGLDILAQRYLADMMSLLKNIATRKNHVNTLQHIQGYLKTHMDNDDKAELSEIIADYRQGLLPLIVPITLLRHHFRKHPNKYIDHSFYMDPHPGEMMLLNHI